MWIFCHFAKYTLVTLSIEYIASYEVKLVYELSTIIVAGVIDK